MVLFEVLRMAINVHVHVHTNVGVCLCMHKCSCTCVIHYEGKFSAETSARLRANLVVEVECGDTAS